VIVNVPPLTSSGVSWLLRARTAMSFGRDVRAAVFHRVGSFSGREVSQFGAPSLITRNTNDVQQVQMLALLTCSLAVQVPIMMVGGIVMAMREDLGLSWLLAVVVPALFLSVGLVVSQMVPSFRQVQSRIDDVNRILREQISGIRVVRAFVREPRERQRFAAANDGLTDVSIRAGRWMATMFPLVMLVVNISSVAGRTARKGAGVYNASKWAVNAFSESLRQEVTGRGVRISLVEPGAVATELSSHITQEEAREASRRMAESMRTLQADDIARAILYVVSQPPHVAINEVLVRPTDQER